MTNDNNMDFVSLARNARGNDGRNHEIRICWARGSFIFHVYLDGEEAAIFSSYVETAREAVDRMYSRLVDLARIPWNSEEHYKLFARAKG